MTEGMKCATCVSRFVDNFNDDSIDIGRSFRFGTLRSALLMSVAAGTLVFASSSFAYAQTSPITPPTAPCDKGVAGSRTAICEGDVSRGVSLDNSAVYDRLVVRKLTRDIAPTSGNGVQFTKNAGSGIIDLDVDASGYSILVRHTAVNAISLDDDVNIRYRGGDVRSSNGRGLYGETSGAGKTVRIDHEGGDISTKETGIAAHASDGGNNTAIIKHPSGNITSEKNGMSAYVSTGGTIKMVHKNGDIGAAEMALVAQGGEVANVNIENGAVTGGEYGIFIFETKNAVINLDGNVSVIANGDGVTSNAIGFLSMGRGVLNINGEAKLSGKKFDISGHDKEIIINNNGALTSLGIIDLGAGENAFNNAIGALFSSGAEVRLGAGNLLTNAGDLSPAGIDAVGITKITGNYIQKSTGTYTVTIDPSSESGEQADFLDIVGSAELDGRLKVVPVPDIPVESQLTGYAVMQAGAGKPAGEFTRIANVKVPLDRLSYDKNGGVYLDLSGIRLSDLAMLDEDLSSSIIPSVHGALVSHAQGNVDLINARLQIADADDADESGVMGLSSNTMQSSRDSRFWASVQGTRGKHEATSLSPELKSRQTGLALGFDQQVNEGLRLGIMASHVRGNFDQNVGNASGRDKTFSLGAYGSSRVSSSSPLRIGFGGLYNWHRLEGSRTPEETGVSLSSSHKAHSWQLFGEASYRVDMSNGFSLEPFAGLSHMNFKSDPFTETGGDGALRASSSSRGTTFSTLGVRGSLKVDDTLRVYGMAGWRRAFGKVVPSVEFSHVNGPSSPFMISGSPIARNSALVQVGASFALSSDTSLSASYTGQYAKKIRTHGANVRLSVKF